ncbi:hypothetical protein [Emticicia sp. 21SJ11W-3]|uniref:hypothetical protein n=1 Tax=Emticicia sp. 21SJ11W-3 TaxID=2916755 RepID=UPI0020A106FD|nr:hypothetical protein [Emticicia sp. 21SJ11W-3]UTA67672.1 hypothetical protein MB380_19040 [Emticicia sp. 21SJ11W-3]
MFTRKTLKIAAIVAIIVCILGILLSLLVALTVDKMAFLQVLSWLILVYASYCAMKLTGYDIYEEDLKKIGWSIYALFVIFVLFLFIGLSLGPIIALVITARLHFQKTSIESWIKDNS